MTLEGVSSKSLSLSPGADGLDLGGGAEHRALGRAVGGRRGRPPPGLVARGA